MIAPLKYLSVGSMRAFVVPALVLSVLPFGGLGADTGSLWLIWERGQSLDPFCAGPNCEIRKAFRSHFILNMTDQESAVVFKSLEPLAQRYGTANMVHEKLPICLDDLAQDATTALATADETLRAIGGVFVDVRGVAGPPGYSGSFGATAQDRIDSALQAVGLKKLSKNEMTLEPGAPELKLRFSPAVQGCKMWSLSLSLAQNLLIERDTTLMIRGTTWSGSSAQKQDDFDFSIDDAMTEVLEKFVAAYFAANNPRTADPNGG
ncbi:hypothetical protein OS190_13140 [Sulfitobacter sp. F26204]|uniref:hypothetical protein n=1 Tax=Sulfitobacter sp. F26204 TaxID=2996014 RepID=UPI00225DD981|nr:hypothetical protein [Sulfitobacter sp. F26204]MCX7560515.1 hypothetical protein [Sulfitobacter sp. F26204]